MNRPVDVNLLMVLAVVLQTRSVSRAAERLGLSQPTVSRALSQLRTSFSDPLLVRSGVTMALTQRAMELAGPLEEWMTATSTLLKPATFSPTTLDRRFVIASSDYGVLSVISPKLPVVRAAAPACHIEIAAYSDDMFHKLAVGEIDVIVYGFEPGSPAMHVRPLFSETQSIVVRQGHPLASSGPDAVSLEAYLAWPHIAISIGANGYDHVAYCLGERNADRQILASVPYFYAAADLLGDSDAILTMPTRAATKFAKTLGLVRLPAPAQIAGFDYRAIVHERSVRDPATQWLVDRLASDTCATDRVSATVGTGGRVQDVRVTA